MRLIFSTFSLAATILIASACLASAQTTATGPYYALPSWDQTIACTAPASCPRFVVLSNMNNDAVLDRETGLAWQRSPSDTKVQGASLRTPVQGSRSEIGSAGGFPHFQS